MTNVPESSRPEFSRIVRAHEIGTPVRIEDLTSSAAEREALARRFDLPSLTNLTAALTLHRDAAGIKLNGRIEAAGEQACVISAEPVPFTLSETVDLRFSDVVVPGGDDIELAVPDLDTMPLDGDELDLGEVVAQSLGLALDPYPRAPEAVLKGVARYLTTEEEAEAETAAAKARANPFNVLRRD